MFKAYSSMQARNASRATRQIVLASPADTIRACGHVQHASCALYVECSVDLMRLT